MCVTQGYRANTWLIHAPGLDLFGQRWLIYKQQWHCWHISVCVSFFHSLFFDKLSFYFSCERNNKIDKLNRILTTIITSMFTYKKNDDKRKANGCGNIQFIHISMIILRCFFFQSTICTAYRNVNSLSHCDWAIVTVNKCDCVRHLNLWIVRKNQPCKLIV